jgi:hypothetical protein
MRKQRWLSRSKEYSGHAYRLGNRLIKVELSKTSQMVLAYDNNQRLKAQVANGELS